MRRAANRDDIVGLDGSVVCFSSRAAFSSPKSALGLWSVAMSARVSVDDEVDSLWLRVARVLVLDVRLVSSTTSPCSLSTGLYSDSFLLARLARRVRLSFLSPCNTVKSKTMAATTTL